MRIPSIYNRALSATEVINLHCRGRRNLDCVGLLGWWRFEGETLDSSDAAWSGQVLRSNQVDDMFTARDTALDGSRALQLLGRGAHIILGPRILGTALSICADVLMNITSTVNRIVDMSRCVGAHDIRQGAADTFASSPSNSGPGSNVSHRLEASSTSPV